MKQSLQRVWKNIRQGESIDVYVSIVLAIILAVLDLIGAVPASWVTAVTLAVLALLATGILGNRYRLEVIQDSLSQSTAEVLLESYPAEVEAKLGKASEVWLVGASLSRTIKEYYALIEGKLKRGESVKVIIRDPEGETCGLIVRHSFKPITEEEVKAEIRLTLGRLCNLQKISPEKLEIRVIDHHLSLGMFAVNPDKPNGSLYVEHYPFKVSHASLPKLVLSPEDGYWYDFFKAQLFAIWQNGRSWQCKS